ncbi:MAG TPA: hypothetical protein VGD08_10160, partial [Stellaceae bacterium]
LSRREFRDGRTLLEGLHGVRHWLDRGRACAFSTAEFQTIAEALERLGAFDLLAGYATAAAGREPEEPLYEFYILLARIEGRSERLTPADAARLEAIARKAGERRDLKLVSRITAFVGAGLPKLPIDWDDLDEAFADPFEEAFGLPDTDDVDFGALDAVAIRAIELLETHPAAAVVDILVRDVADGPLGRGLPKAALREMVTMIVGLAAGQVGGRRRAGRRHRGR